MADWGQVRAKLQSSLALSFEDGDRVRFRSITPEQFTAVGQKNRWGKMTYKVSAVIRRGEEQLQGFVYLTERQALQVIDLDAFADSEDIANWGAPIFVTVEVNDRGQSSVLFAR